MRKTIGIGVLTAFSTMLGLVPLTVNAQIAPNQVIICAGPGVTGQFSFKLNGTVRFLNPGKCGTYSGASIFLFYTEYARNPRYILERQLSGGRQYQIEKNTPNTKRGHYEVLPVEFRRI